MQEAIQITFRGMEPSDFIERRIMAKAADLERFCREIVSCHVTVETQHNKHHKGNLYAVRIDLRVPGKEIVAGRSRTMPGCAAATSSATMRATRARRCTPCSPVTMFRSEGVPR